jgi:hypothetical protein
LEDGQVDASIPMGCGEAGEVLGELIEPRFFATRIPRTGDSHAPKYEVPTVCDCEQYCIDEVSRGCRSYRFINGYCYLQGSPVAPYVNPSNTAHFKGAGAAFEVQFKIADVMSGTLKPRILEVSATESSLTLLGVNLPAAGTAASKAQRVL